MTFNPSQPTVTSSPKISVVDIQANFATFATIFAKNHKELNDFNQGKHGVVILEKMTASPTITQDLTVIYNKNATSAADTQPQLFLKIPTFLPTDNDPTTKKSEEMQVTYNKVNLAGPMYQSFMLGGLLVYFGQTNSIATPIVLSPIPKKILNVQVSAQGTSSTQNATNVAYDIGVVVTQPKTIKINSTRAPANGLFSWMAIATA